MGDVNFTPRTWVAGETVTAALLNAQVRDPLTQLQAAWTSYSPLWTAATTNPSVGNGSLIGDYHRIGKTIIWSILLSIGSTTTLGTGAWIFTLPVTAGGSSSSWPVYSQSRVPGNLIRHALLTSATTFQLFDVAGTAVTGTTVSWVAGNVMSVCGMYEAA